MERKLRVSRRGAVRFVILFAAVFMMWWFFRSYILFLALLMVLGVTCASALILWQSRDFFAVHMIMPEARVARNTEFPFSVIIDNSRKFIGFTADIRYNWGNVFTGYRQVQTEHVFLAPVKGCVIRQSVRSEYAGRVDTETEEFTVYDPLHLFYLKGLKVKNAGVLVSPMPAVTGADELYSCVEGFPRLDESRKLGTEYSPDYEIREYIPGDELKNIHWKLTAKQDKLMVRERLASGRLKMNVLLPLTDDKKENDGLVDSLYYLGELLLEKEYPIQLYWVGVGNELRSSYIAETGELEAAIGEVLSGNGIRATGSAREQMELEHPGETYILVKTGAYKGAYIR